MANQTIGPKKVIRCALVGNPLPRTMRHQALTAHGDSTSKQSCQATTPIPLESCDGVALYS